MNLNRIISMGMRMLMQRGVKKGIDVAARRGKSEETMTPEERASAQKLRGHSKTATRSAKMLRRFMR